MNLHRGSNLEKTMFNIPRRQWKQFVPDAKKAVESGCILAVYTVSYETFVDVCSMVGVDPHSDQATMVAQTNDAHIVETHPQYYHIFAGKEIL